MNDCLWISLGICEHCDNYRCKNYATLNSDIAQKLVGRLERLDQENADLKERNERQGRRILIMLLADWKGPGREKVLDHFEHLEVIADHMPECPADVLPPEVFSCGDITGCHGQEGITACWRRVLGIDTLIPQNQPRGE